VASSPGHNCSSSHHGRSSGFVNRAQRGTDGVQRDPGRLQGCICTYTSDLQDGTEAEYVDSDAHADLRTLRIQSVCSMWSRDDSNARCSWSHRRDKSAYPYFVLGNRFPSTNEVIMSCDLRPVVEVESCPTSIMDSGTVQYRFNGNGQTAYFYAML
jgi:hypothetical protein